ncbi:hypothetical protein HFV04_024885 [Pseudomonas sp. BIGb0427]|uniref:hypothetical protein n=1 Tax=Pseudomonas TaxID=286 RepID=UPI000A67BFAA|nr:MULTISPECIES: hypothetical protein [unclassified Pseudomonas]QPG62712.1 hypothetical protein HFV04_024885 [Pseudomonas sp. BIGb0427]QVM98560.1 hypothetical protein JYG36_10460 [Pseudomonas sp. SORT22]UVL54562.1 hypothetical protein LOY22_17030 [Pseudomonas sp. B21-035]UVL59895.1 hypothetical protein LOY54_17835 [Pseudomonas sp. B21-032]UVM65115.1 hypothetical protein LOY34_17465 [Pseudomonas sp. B21-009]
MSLTMAILLLLGAWLSVAAAMLWGVLRIARRHHPHHRIQPEGKDAVPLRRSRRHAGAH